MNALTSARQTAVIFTSEEIERPFHKHCPLCVDEMIYPEESNQAPVFIFLDMDGVLIGDRFSSWFCDVIYKTVSSLFPHRNEFTDYHWTVANAKHLKTYALQSLYGLIDRIEKAGRRPLVVLSSAWRNDATLQQHREDVFTQHQFCKYLAGKTAPQDGERSFAPECKQGFNFTKGARDVFNLNLNNRADVIEFWLRDHGFELDRSDFVILDDDIFSGLQRFGKRFIQIDDLLSEEDCMKAAKILKVYDDSLELESVTKPSIPIFPANTLAIRVIYPDIGRKLKVEDIGKKIIRIFPSPHNGDYDWSFCYWKGQNQEVHTTDTNVLQQINNDGSLIIFDELWRIKGIWSAKWNDAYWTTIDELYEQLLQNPKQQDMRWK